MAAGRHAQYTVNGTSLHLGIGPKLGRDELERIRVGLLRMGELPAPKTGPNTHCLAKLGHRCPDTQTGTPSALAGRNNLESCCHQEAQVPVELGDTEYLG